MSQFGGVERPGPWETAGDHERRIRALEAVPTCCEDPCTALDDLILENPCLAAFWKLNESGGDIAFDSGPGGYDCDSGAGSPPTWAEATTPFGEPSPQFGTGILEANIAFPALTDDLTLEVWANRDTDSGVNMLSQGDPYSANTAGVALGWVGEGTPTTYTARGVIGDTSGGPHTILETPFDPDGEWHHFVLTREETTWTLYIDGVAIDTFDDGGTNYSSTTGIQIGNIAGSLTANRFPGNLSYAAAYTCALTASEVATHYERGAIGCPACEGGIDSTENAGESCGVHSGSGTTCAPEGYVLTSDGECGTTWSEAGGGGVTVLDYTEFTSPVTISATTEAAGTTVVTAGSVTTDGSTLIAITFYAPSIIAAATTFVLVHLWEGSTELGRIGIVHQGGTTAMMVTRYLTPSAGSHTYTVKAHRGTADGTIIGGAGGTNAYMPGYVRITSGS